MMYIRQIKQEMLERMMTNDGLNLYRTTFTQPVMLVFLRHFGCIFCKEALLDISNQRETIESKGSKIVFVHMATDEIAQEYLEKFQLQDVSRISDPTSQYYRLFGLGKGSITQLFGLSTFIRGFDIVVQKGQPIEYNSGHLGDSFQMPGVFVLQNGKIQESYIHKLASSRPDYEKLVDCCAI